MKLNKTIEENINNDLEPLTIWKILAYFIIFSLLGFIIEVIYCATTWGIVQIRQTFLYGPFCCVYGTGAVFVILALRRFSKNKLAVFSLGFLVGSIVEYMLSVIGEVFFNMRWWDYSHQLFNLNGRICLKYSLFWGVLSLLIICVIVPLFDRLLDKLKNKFGIVKLKSTVFIISAFIFIDFLLALFALNMYMTRLIRTYDFDLQYPETSLSICSKLYENPTINNITYKFFGDKKMMISFPNLRALDQEGNIVDVSSLLPEHKNYYFKIYDK